MQVSNIGKKDLIPATVWIILGILMIIGSYELDLGKLQTPGPGMFPFLLGVILILVSLPILISALKDIRRSRKKKVNIWGGVDFLKMGAIVAVLLAYGLLLERVGFSVTAFLCLFFLFKVVGSETLSKALVLSSVTVIASYLLFIIALKVYMPLFPWRDLANIFF